jgi:hypothetical protein
MHFSIYRDFAALVAGVLCFFTLYWIFGVVSPAFLNANGLGYDLVVSLFARNELPFIYLSLCNLAGGLTAGLIARRCGFVLGALVALTVFLHWYVLWVMGYHPALTESQFVKMALARALGWSLQAAVAGIAGVALATTPFAKRFFSPTDPFNRPIARCHANCAAAF